MKSTYKALRSNYIWRADNKLNRFSLNGDIGPWLIGKGSLTASLIGVSKGSFGVTILAQRLCVPLFHEQQKLGRPVHRAAMVREVELTISAEPVVYARSIIPLNLVLHGRSGLANLGRTPLGHLLFRDGRIRISKRQFASIDVASSVISARRTPYEYMGSTILVSEFFLPAFDKYLESS